MVWFIKTYAQSYLEKEMHNDNYRYRNPVGSIFAFIFMMIGIVVLVGFVTGVFRHIFWPFPLIGTLIGVFVLVAIISSIRRRAYYREVERQKHIRYGVYQPTENPYWKNLEVQKAQEKEQEQEPIERVVSNTLFCDYCGMKLTEEMSYCTNCGNKLN